MLHEESDGVSDSARGHVGREAQEDGAVVLPPEDTIFIEETKLYKVVASSRVVTKSRRNLSFGSFVYEYCAL